MYRVRIRRIFQLEGLDSGAMLPLEILEYGYHKIESGSYFYIALKDCGYKMDEFNRKQF